MPQAHKVWKELCAKSCRACASEQGPSDGLAHGSPTYPEGPFSRYAVYTVFGFKGTQPVNEASQHEPE